MLSKRTTLILIAAVIGVMCLCCQAAFCQDSDEAKWKYSWTGLGWIPGMDGDVTIAGQSADVDVSVSDAFDIVKDADKKFSARIEAEKGPVGFQLGLLFLKDESDKTTPLGGRIEIEPSLFIGDIAYVMTTNKTETQTTKFKGGFRYTKGEAEIEIEDSLGAKIFDQSRDQDWWDFFIGGIIEQAIAPKWMLVFDGDVGVGLDEEAEFSWGADLGFRKDIGKSRSLVFGWRVLDQEYEDKPNFKWDIQMSGPYLGLRSEF